MSNDEEKNRKSQVSLKKPKEEERSPWAKSKYRKQIIADRIEHKKKLLEKYFKKHE